MLKRIYLFVLLLLSCHFSYSQSLTNEQYALEFCKIWGIVKYHHPHISSKTVDINHQFLILYPEMLLVNDSISFNNLVEKFLDNFDKKSFYEVTEDELESVLTNRLYQLDNLAFLKDSAIYSSQLEFSWIRKSQLNISLQHKLAAFIIHFDPIKHPNAHMAHDIHFQDFQHIFLKENLYTALPAITPDYATLALFQSWNIIEYFFPYQKWMDQSWETSFLEVYPLFKNVQNRDDYLYAMRRLVALTNDSNSYLTDLDRKIPANMTYDYPINFSYVEDKIVVSKILDSDFCASNQIQLGDVIQSINQKSAAEWLDYLRKVIPVSINKNFSYVFARYLFEELPDAVQINLFENQGSISIQRMLKKKNPNEQSFTRDTIYGNDIAYINPFVLKDKDEPAVFKKIQTCKALILDLRFWSNTKGSSWDYLVSRLSDDGPRDVWSYSKTHGKWLGFFKKDPPVNMTHKNTNFGLTNYPEKIIALINQDSKADMESFAMELKIYAPQTVFIGSTSAGANGVGGFVDLLGNVHLKFTTWDFHYADGTQFQRKGIEPTVVVRPTVEGIKEGRDEVLEKAIEWINQH